MRGRTMMAVVVAMVLCAATPTTAAVTAVCNGTACGGDGPRDYWYEVTTTQQYDGFEFAAGTADRSEGNYGNSMVAYLVGDAWVELDDGANPGGDYDTFWGYGPQLDIHAPKTVHGGGPVTPNGKSNMVIMWSVYTILNPAGTYGFGYDNDTDPLDVSWFFDEGGPPEDATSDWSKVVGMGKGPVHGPLPEPATLALLVLGGLGVLLRGRRKSGPKS